MDSEGYMFDTVKSEKMKAMAKYNRFKKIKTLLLVSEVLIALTMISWSSTYLPQVLKVSGEFFNQLADYLFKPRVVFLIGNAIVVALVVLCRENDASNNHSSGSGDIYDEYVHLSQDQQQTKSVSLLETDKTPPTSPAPENETAAGINDPEEKQIVCVAPVEEKTLKDVELDKKEEKEEENKSTTVTAAVQDATQVVQKFQRTQSARLKKEFPVTPPGLELRRSETCRRSAATSFESVESLSNEEFNLTVAAFIKRHQEFLLSQKLAENEGL